ncbi:XRE family transcriptional regulator [Corynebacterium diphtheriae]|uniref:transcriptional regulator n=1 Tax=Corynebacterium diphtheriae TaxID=1717 RepID=UPI000B4B3A77|nr:transcriptional regulator [Corynebacterium diphtheriae]MBG9274779.1 XRE family transcriptional regulator [Corynebacterium diphtheriae bv. mitis]OWO24032.1 hypothetical protein AY535_08515 [Corynebacterium diphtheriae bv. gravis]OWX96584.1 hypothetical protein B1A53_10830 [Corynebacterium diphtheriae]CAB0519198.1 transcriptional regulator [Corynebacterium diphtheriae]CAB0525645.1 transcriptional regulator [Corynebacterium diphtheriae]
MHKVLVSLDEIDRVKRIQKIATNDVFAEKLDIHRNTLREYLQTRKVSDVFINGLVRLGARPNKLLVLVDEEATASIAA